MGNMNMPQGNMNRIENESEAMDYYDYVAKTNRLEWGQEPSPEQYEKGEVAMKAEELTKKILETADEKILAILPKEHLRHFTENHLKHFVPETAVGSLFKDVKDTEEILKLAAEQRGGSLDGDDRQKFLDLGVPESALLPFCRYIFVETKGEVGIAKLTELSDTDQVEVIRTKSAAPCSLVVKSNNLPETNLGTIIIGPNEKQKGENAPEPSTKEMIWSMHPGLPVRPGTEDSWEEGSVISVAEVKKVMTERLGDISNVYLNIKREK